MTPLELVLHFTFGLALLGAYLALTMTGHDGNAVFGLLGGQAIGAGISRAAGK